MITIQLETVSDGAVLTQALNDLIAKGYKELADTAAHEAGAIETATEWDSKIETAKKLLKQL